MVLDSVCRRGRQVALVILTNVALALFAPASASAANVTLGWDPSTATNIAGYNLYYGGTTGTYTNVVTAGNTTNATVTGLASGVTYYFAATAFDTSGLESDYSAEVVYTVAAPAANQPPTIAAISSITVLENAGQQTVNLSGITSGASNEVQSLVVSASSGTTSVIPNPTVSYSSPGQTGSLTFTPVAGTFGSSTITVTVNDGGASNNVTSRTFTVTVLPVNNQPTLNALADATVNENASQQSVSLAGIGTGAANETQTLTVTASSSDTSIIPNPTVTYTSPNATGSIAYKPVSNAVGVATITVTVNDGATSNNVVSRTFQVTVNPVNQAPTLAALSSTTILEGAGPQTVNLSGISSGAANENQTLTVTSSSSNTGLIPNPTVTYTSPNATGSIGYTPVLGAFGTSTLTVSVNDGGASNNVVSRTMTVTVLPVNNQPTVDALSDVTVLENALQQTVSLSGITSGASNETQTLTVTASSSNTGLVPNPTVTYTSPNATGTLAFKPATNGFGTATITVTVNDGSTSNNVVTKTFAINVLPVNQTPTLATIGNVSLLQNAGQQTVNLTGIGSGAANESQTLSITASSSNTGLIPNPSVTYTSPNATGSLAFTPAAGASGLATVTVTVNDGGATNSTFSRTFTVSVGAVNQAPTLDALNNITINQNAGLQNVALTGISSGSASENQTLTVTATSGTTSVIPTPSVSYTSPNASGSISFSPSARGTSTISVTVNDGGTSNNIVTRTFSVTVNGQPTITSIAGLTIANDSASSALPFTISDPETAAGSLSVSATSDNQAVLANGGLALGGTGANRNITVTPIVGQVGDANVTVTVSDGSASASTTFLVSVRQKPSAPGNFRVVSQ